MPSDRTRQHKAHAGPASADFGRQAALGIVWAQPSALAHMGLPRGGVGHLINLKNESCSRNREHQLQHNETACTQMKVPLQIPTEVSDVVSA